MRRIAGTLVVLGAFLVIVSTGGLTSVQADRGTFVDVATEDSAFVALEPTGNMLNPQTDPTVVGQIWNNFDVPVTVAFDVQSDFDGVAPDPASGETSLLPGETIDIEATCDPPNGGTGTATFTVTFDADGNSVRVSDGEFTMSVAYECQGNPGGPGTPGPPGPGGPGRN